MILATFVLYVFCDELHTTKIWEVLVDKWWLAWWKPSTCLFTYKASHRPCVENSYILARYSSDENRPHHQDFWRTFAHEFGWHGVFLFVKRCQRRSLRYLHSVVLWYTPLAFTLVRRFLRILCTWWHFVQLSCVCSWAVVRLVVAMCGLLENIITPWCVRGALSEAWNHMMVVLPFRCLRRGPSDDQCYICIEWLCGTHESPWRLQEVCT